MAIGLTQLSHFSVLIYTETQLNSLPKMQVTEPAFLEILVSQASANTLLFCDHTSVPARGSAIHIRIDEYREARKQEHYQPASQEGLIAFRETCLLREEQSFEEE